MGVKKVALWHIGYQWTPGWKVTNVDWRLFKRRLFSDWSWTVVGQIPQGNHPRKVTPSKLPPRRTITPWKLPPEDNYPLENYPREQLSTPSRGKWSQEQLPPGQLPLEGFEPSTSWIESEVNITKTNETNKKSKSMGNMIL